MPNPTNEYLVKLGFKTDVVAANQALDFIGRVRRGVKGLALGPLAQVTAGFLTVAGAAAKATTILAGFVDTISEADRETERLAKKWATSEKVFRAYSNALEELNLDMNDLLYISDEDYQRFIELTQFGQSLEAPTELKNTLNIVRDIKFELSKLTTIITYLRRWVVYWLGKFIGKDLQNIEDFLSKVTNFASNVVPIISKKIAQGLAIVFQVVKDIFWLGKAISTGVYNFISRLDMGTMKIISAFSLIGFALLKGPIGKAILVISAFLLLLDDYLGWKRGIKSFFDWSGVQGIAEVFSEVSGILAEIINQIAQIFDFKFSSLQEVLDGFLDTIKLIGAMLGYILNIIHYISKWKIWSSWETKQADWNEYLENQKFFASMMGQVLGNAFSYEGMFASPASSSVSNTTKNNNFVIEQMTVVSDNKEDFAKNIIDNVRFSMVL